MQAETLFGALHRAEVRCILIGGVAAWVHGSVRMTVNVDFVYDRAPDNLKRIVEALAPCAPYPRGAPPGLPFRFDESTLSGGLNFPLTTTLGEIDLLGEVPGGGRFLNLQPHSFEDRAFGIPVRCVDLPTLIRLKRAAGRPRDFEAIAELEALLEERGR